MNLIGVIGLQSLGVGNIFRSGAQFGQAGAAVDLPIFDGGRRKARYRGARRFVLDVALVKALGGGWRS